MPIEGAVGSITWVAFWAAVIAVILVKHRQLVAHRRAQTDPDALTFSEVRPTKYLIVACCVGVFVLPFYFYAVHRTARGFLIGLGWLAGIAIGIFGLRYATLAVLAPRPFVQLYPVGDLEMNAPNTIFGTVPAFGAFGVKVFDFQDGAVLENSIVWYEEGKGEFGRGTSATGNFGPGKHVIRVKVTDSDGNKVEKTASFNVTVRQTQPTMPGIGE